LETQHENSSDNTSRDGHVLDLCVICMLFTLKPKKKSKRYGFYNIILDLGLFR